jgi:hypothetical protein
MERSCLTVTIWRVGGWARLVAQVAIMTALILGTWVSFSSKVALGAGIILSRPEVIETHESQESFPLSRFGSPPSRIDSDGKSRFVANAMEDLRQNEVGGVANSGEGLVSNRKPAGLEFTQDTGRANSAQPRSVIGESGMPHSPANINPQPETSNNRTGIQEVAIIASDLGFFPKTVFVTRDIPVRMYVTGASKRTLCIMMDLENLQVRKQVHSQKIEELSFTPTQSGQFRFYCPVNGIEGTLLVKDANFRSGPAAPSGKAPASTAHGEE